jgi:hypothetical protein
MNVSKKIPFSRRQEVVGCGIGGIVPAFAQGQAPSAPPQLLTDPTTKYPKPPYKKQSQAWPGLAR